MQIVRKFSAAGPCLTLGKLSKETEKFYVYAEWQGGDRYEGEHRVMKGRVHIEPCHSCRDHEHTQYPNGYMD